MRHLLNDARIISCVLISCLLVLTLTLAQTLYEASLFMDEPAGLRLNFSLISINLSSSYWRLFLACCLNTLCLGSVSIVLSTILAVIIAMMRESKVELISTTARLYVTVFRNLPLLGVILSTYFLLLYALPDPKAAVDVFTINKRYMLIPVTYVGDSLLKLFFVASCFVAAYLYNRACSKRLNWYAIVLIAAVLWIVAGAKAQSYRLPLELSAMILALMLHSSSYIAEIIRSGFRGINPMQHLSALSLGLSQRQSLCYVCFPQVMIRIMPPLISQYANIIKNASLGAVIGYPDIIAIFSGTVVNQTGNVKEIIILICLFYGLVNVIMSQLLSLCSKSAYEKNS